MPSASPSPVKRPSMTERTSSNHSLSSSGKQTTIHKVNRPHVVGKHSRNVSHGKNLSKLNRVHSAANVTDLKAHGRKRSGGAITPKQSPTSPGLPKRVGSHVQLAKNTSHTNLRKNHSATALAPGKTTAVKKLGLAPTPKPKKEEQKTGFFEIGDGSSGDEEENEWEDSTTQSPELTRNNSKASTPARIATPNGERLPQKLPEPTNFRRDRTSSPPPPTLRPPDNNRSLPDLRRDSDNVSPGQPAQNPAILNNGQRSQAPSAMATALNHPELLRKESSKDFTHIDHSDAHPPPSTFNTGTGSSAADGGVSHFLNSTPTSQTQQASLPSEDASDSDSGTFMSNYKGSQPSPSPTKQPSQQLNRSYFPSIPSRTQQKLELQRRETMRSSNANAPAPTSLAITPGSSLSLHSRTGSRGGARARTSAADEAKIIKSEYEAGIKQLSVVRRFRNPVMESMTRLKDRNTLPTNIGTVSPSAAGKSRPQSRRGPSTTATTASTNGNTSRSDANHLPTVASTAESEERKPTSTSSGGGGRVHFQSQRESHEDIGITPAHNTSDGVGAESDDDEGMTVEEGIMRRLWSSREVWVREAPTVG